MPVKTEKIMKSIEVDCASTKGTITCLVNNIQSKTKYSRKYNISGETVTLLCGPKLRI